MLTPGEYSKRVDEWLLSTFGEKVTINAEERNLRFLEEALELLQSLGLSKDQLISMINYVYSRPVGNPNQEVGGVFICLLALCNTHSIDLFKSFEEEITRCWNKQDIIRSKHANKPDEIRMKM